MLLALENAITKLLQHELPSLFTGPGAASATFSVDTWDFDRLSADPVAGQPGPEDAVDELAFDPAAAAGPYALTRPPYPGPKRVYLRATSGELVALASPEVVWNPADPAAFSIQPLATRDLAGFDHLHIMYGVVAAATRLKTLHKLTLQIAGADPDSSEKAFALALAVLVLNRDALLRDGGFAWTAGGYQAEGAVKTLKFSAGAVPAPTSRTLSLEAEVDLRLERLLGEGEGKPIMHILSSGRTPGSKPVDIDPAVQA